MDLIDTLSVVLGCCNCGSDYKSWGLVCQEFYKTLKSSFPTPKWLFGNKLINIIEQTGLLSVIGNHEIAILDDNPYVPRSWKDKNYELKIDLVQNDSMIFYRPFENNKSFIEFYENTPLQIKASTRVVHASVPLSTIVDNCKYISWELIPITHNGFLSDDDWVILKKFGVIDNLPTTIPEKSDHSSKALAWCKYPTTTVSMIERWLSTDDRYISPWTPGLYLQCPNITQEKAINIIIDNKSHKQLNLLVRGLLANTFGQCFHYSVYF